MRIAIDTGFHNESNPVKIYTVNRIVSLISRELPGTVFYLPGNGGIQPFDDAVFTQLQNRRITGKNRLKTAYRYSFSLPALLRKNRIDLVLSFIYRRIKTPVPRVYYADDLAVLSFLKRPRADEYIATDSAFLKERIEQSVKVAAGSTRLMAVSGAPFPDLPSFEAEKDYPAELTGGKHYFFCYTPGAGINRVVTVLKGFSYFKKRQQSSFKIVFFIDENELPLLEKQISAYKYRTDVVLVSRITVPAFLALSAGAYAQVLISGAARFISAGFLSLSMNVPLLSDVDFIDGNDRVISLFDGDKPQQLGERLIRLYTDEKFREERINAGKDMTGPGTAGNWKQLLLQVTGKPVD